MKKVLKILQTIFIVLLAVLICLNLYNVVARSVFKKNMAKVFGVTTAVVVTGSMTGAINVGDQIIVAERSSYEVGDVITFLDGKSYVTHRIIEVNEDGSFVTKGDANNTKDANPVDVANVVGKVVFTVRTMWLVIAGIALFGTSLAIKILENGKQDDEQEAD